MMIKYSLMISKVLSKAYYYIATILSNLNLFGQIFASKAIYYYAIKFV